jgi:uncharacterized protein YggU (UPF0235/DUF167 family)
VRIVRGESARDKLVRIDGCTEDEARTALLN